MSSVDATSVAIVCGVALLHAYNMSRLGGEREER
jgi:hypothetical protein